MQPIGQFSHVGFTTKLCQQWQKINGHPIVAKIKRIALKIFTFIRERLVSAYRSLKSLVKPKPKPPEVDPSPVDPKKETETTFPFEKLPPDIQSQIFSYLYPKDARTKIQLLSEAWQGRYPKIAADLIKQRQTRFLDFIPDRKLALQFMKDHGKNIEYLELDHRYHDDIKKMIEVSPILSSCPNVTDLTFVDQKSFSQFSLGNFNWIKERISLNSLTFRKISMLMRFFLLLSENPSLKELEISNCTISQVVANLDKKNFSSLQKLTWDKTPLTTFTQYMQVPLLKELIIQHVTMLPHELQRLSQITSLEKLVLSSHGNGALNLLQNLTSLQELCITEGNTSGIQEIKSLKKLILCCVSLEDSDIEQFATLPNLEELELIRCVKLTNKCHRFFKSYPKLKKVTVAGCPGLADTREKTFYTNFDDVMTVY